MRPVRQTFSMAAADADGICTSQTPSGAGALTINGALAATVTDTSVWPSTTKTVGDLDVARRVIITSAGNDSAKTFVVAGLNRYSQPLSETVTGANAGVATTLNNFLRVDSVTVSAATAGAVTVGTSNAAEGPWIPLARYRHPFEVGINGTVSGTLTFGIQYTNSDIQAEGFQEADANAFDHATITGKTASFAGTQMTPVIAIRAKITGYSSGSLELEVVQS